MEATQKDIQDILESDLSCAICQDIYINPLVLNCSHSFCKFCVYTWLSKKSFCPQCRVTVSFQAENLALRNIINKMVQKSSQQFQKSRTDNINQRLKDEEQLDREGVTVLFNKNSMPSNSARRNIRSRRSQQENHRPSILNSIVVDDVGLQRSGAEPQSLEIDWHEIVVTGEPFSRPLPDGRWGIRYRDSPWRLLARDSDEYPRDEDMEESDSYAGDDGEDSDVDVVDAEQAMSSMGAVSDVNEDDEDDNSDDEDFEVDQDDLLASESSASHRSSSTSSSDSSEESSNETSSQSNSSIGSPPHLGIQMAFPTAFSTDELSSSSESSSDSQTTEVYAREESAEETDEYEISEFEDDDSRQQVTVQIDSDDDEDEDQDGDEYFSNSDTRPEVPWGQGFRYSRESLVEYASSDSSDYPRYDRTWNYS